MQVVQLFVKPDRHAPMLACDHLKLRRGYGIDGDVNARMGSPRQVLIVGTPTLDRFQLQPDDLRANIVLNTAVESLTSGQVLQVNQTLIRLTFFCEPCAALNNVQPQLARRIQQGRGMLGLVLQDGEIHTGDRVTVLQTQFPPLSDTTRGRFTEFVSRIPWGRVVTTADIILALGLTRSHYRAIPILLKKSTADLPIHRIITREGRLMPKYIPAQSERLQQEGIPLIANCVPERYYWPPIAFHALDLPRLALSSLPAH